MPQQDSSPRSQQLSGRYLTPQTTWPPGSVACYHGDKIKEVVVISVPIYCMTTLSVGHIIQS
jgi:hypothetical protein